MRRHITTAVVITGALLTLPIFALAQVWTAPTANPTGNNTATPINVSSVDQSKTGGFSVGTLLYAGQGLGVGINPYDTNGSVNALKYCINGANCISTWPSGGISNFTINTAGGVTGGGTINSTGGSLNLNIDKTTIQSRVTGTCSGGQFMLSVNQDGSVGCGTPSGGGTVTSVGAGSNISISGTAAAPVVNVVNSPTFSGNVTAPGFYYSSDRNLKTNITDLDPSASLQNVLDLQGVSFNWKKDGTASVGLIAQDVEKVYPQLVTTDSTTGLKSVEYGNLVAPLIEAVKTQQKEIDALKAEVEALKASK